MNGVPLFFPFSKKRIKFPVKFKTGGKVETIVFHLALFLVALFLIPHSWVNFVDKSIIKTTNVTHFSEQVN